MTSHHQLICRRMGCWLVLPQVSQPVALHPLIHRQYKSSSAHPNWYNLWANLFVPNIKALNQILIILEHIPKIHFSGNVTQSWKNNLQARRQAPPDRTQAMGAVKTKGGDHAVGYWTWFKTASKKESLMEAWTSTGWWFKTCFYLTTTFIQMNFTNHPLENWEDHQPDSARLMGRHSSWSSLRCEEFTIKNQRC